MAATLQFLRELENIDFDEFDDDVVEPDFVPNIVNLQGKKHHS